MLQEVGTEQEQAAATLGSNWWQTFWRVTLPSIGWGLTYGVVLTTARTLGEFGGVIMVSSNLPGESQTLTLLVNDRTDQEPRRQRVVLQVRQRAKTRTRPLRNTVARIVEEVTDHQ